ncbi:hypothetical protein LPB140_03940 [Sphingorhabdus lutea]|uniref:DUF4402 domain-containing protein n=1 Tax=Sphingorhabdus lutea TaxID=1913578 RepID=A0A1L3JAF4_9SPHN|nr:DUF4402 domain-containing protein [Sphingorhabdus lutea]APG62099.1 hypothetical protein LPB140_03940 [Sphingorhabdus lutea]
MWDRKLPILRQSYCTAFVLAGALLLANLPAISSAHAQSMGTSRTTVVKPLSIVSINDLSFGRIIPGTANSNIRIDEDNGNINIASGNATLAGGTVSRGEFTIVADPNTQVRITLPNRTFLNNNSGPQQMRVNRFRLDGPRNRNIGASGTLNFAIGAQLRVGANQAQGIYTGTFDVTVDYR